MANPMVRALGLKELLERDAQTAPEPRLLEGSQVESALASHVRGAWGRNKLAKEQVDLRLLACLRARRGVYSAAELQTIQESGGVNVVWADLTETKCRAASAWVRDVLLPAGDRAWSASPTPVPDLPMPFKKTIVAKSIQQAQEVLIQVSQAGGGTMERDEFRQVVADIGEKLREDAEREYERAARKRAKRMERVIADRLAQGCWEDAMDAFVEDFVTFPAAILKGPTYQRHKRLEWAEDYAPKVSNNPAQTWERVSPFDVYPAPAARTPQQGDFIERMRFWREELHALKGLPGYKDDQIEQALRDYSGGHLEGWLWTEAERQRLEQESMYMWLSPPGVIDALNYWGSVPGWKLLSWGVEGVKDPTAEYEVNVLLCGRFVLYAALNPHPLARRPYRKACYDDIPGAFWGRSIPDLCATHQKMCNAIACALADNHAMASGPMAWIHADRLADGEQTLEIIPWKVWQLKSDPTQGVNPGIGFFQPNDNSQSLMASYEKWELRADDSTGVPRYTYGNERVGGAGNTATGLSMLLNSAAKGLRRAIASIDNGVIAPTIYDCFVNEMLYNPDESIKGDCVIVPRGAAAILIKESAQQRRAQFLAMTANPIDLEIIGTRGRASLLRETAAAMELPVDEVVPSEEELERREQAKAQAQQQQAEQQMQLEQAEREAEVAQRSAEEAAKAQAKEREQITSIVGDLVKKAVAGAMAERQQQRRLRFQYDDAGEIVGAEEF